MSHSLSKSLQDFFESQSRTKDGRFLRSVDHVPSAETFQKQLDDLGNSEQQTLSNDKLIEGYVVIRLEDEKDSAIQSSGKYEDEKGQMNSNIKNDYEESNIFLAETNSSIEDQTQTVVDILTSISEVKIKESLSIVNIKEVSVPDCVKSESISEVKIKESLSIVNIKEVSVPDCVKSVENNYADEKEDSIEIGDNCCDDVVTITNSEGERGILINNWQRKVDISYVNENRVHSDKYSWIEKEDHARPVSELYYENSPTDHEQFDRESPVLFREKKSVTHVIKGFKSNQELYEKESENLQNITENKSMHYGFSSKVANDIEGFDGNHTQEEKDDNGKFGKNEAGNRFVEKYTKLSLVNDNCTTDKCYDGKYDEFGDDSGALEDDNDDNVDEVNKVDIDEDIVSSDGTDEDNDGSKSDAYETCDARTDDECEQENTQRHRKLSENLSGKIKLKIMRKQMESEEKAKHLKENDGGYIKSNLTNVIDHSLTPLIGNRSCLTGDPLLKRKGAKVETDVLNKLNNIQSVIRVPSGVLGDGVRNECIVLGNEDDPYDDTPVTVENLSRLHHYSAELECPKATTGKITETPRYSSVVQELASRAQSGAATELSNVSGRKNPQAKLDSEVRDLERKSRNTQSAQINSTKKALPPIKRDRRSIDRRLTFEKTATCDTKKMEKGPTTVCDVKSQRKPAVPRLLQSSVCYHDGTVDVSIYSDRGLINQSDPVHLNINFVRQPLVPSTSVKSARKNSNGVTKAALPRRMAHGAVTKENRLQQNAGPSYVTRKNFGKLLSPIENPPKLQSPKIIHKRMKHAEKKKSKHKRKKQVRSHSRDQTDIWSSKFDEIDWNIVERRAQKPPFNTHIDPEASQRHMKFFMDFFV